MHICGRIRFYTTIWTYPHNGECEWRYETRWNPNNQSVLSDFTTTIRFYKYSPLTLGIFCMYGLYACTKGGRNVCEFSFKTDTSQHTTKLVKYRSA